MSRALVAFLGLAAAAAITAQPATELRLSRIEVTREYPEAWRGQPAPGVTGQPSETLAANTPAIEIGWDRPWPADTKANRNRVRGTLSLETMPKVLRAGQAATLALTLAATWEGSGFGAPREHTVRLSGQTGAAVWSKMGDPNAPLTGRCQSEIEFAPPSPWPPRLELTAAAEVRFGLLDRATLTAKLVYEAGAPLPGPAQGPGAGTGAAVQAVGEVPPGASIVSPGGGPAGPGAGAIAGPDPILVPGTVTGASTPGASPIGAKLTGFEGPWLCTKDPADGTGPCSIERVQGVMVLKRPKAGPSVGMMLGPKLVRAQDWGPLKGTLSDDEQTLTWANGALWQRPTLGGGMVATGPNPPTTPPRTQPTTQPQPPVTPPTDPPKPPATAGAKVLVPAWGITIALSPKGPVIVTVAPTGLGHDAGLVPGTLILEIGADETKGMTLAQVAAAMSREPLPPIAFEDPAPPEDK